MKVAIASDHAGFELKQRLVGHLKTLGHEPLDLGTDGLDSVDWPDFGAACGRAVVEGQAERGITVCGSGLGIAMAAGKVPGVRVATCHDEWTAEMCRRHNDANVMSLGARILGPQRAESMVEIFLTTPFDGGRHAPRVEKLNALDPTTATTGERS